MGRISTNLIAALATVVVVDIASGLTYPLLNLILENRESDVRLIGLNSAMLPLGIIVIGPFIPRLSNMLGSKRLVQLAIIVTILTLIALPLFPNIWAWFPIRFVMGLASGVLYGLSEAWVMHFADEGSRGRVSAIFNSLLCLGFSIGPFMIPLVGIEGWTPFLIAVVLLVVAALPLFVLDFAEEEFGEEPGQIGFFGFVSRAPLLLFAVLTVTMFDAVMLAFFPIYGLRSGLDLQTASWALGLAIMGNAFTQYPIGWVADRWSRTGVLWIACLVTACLALALPFAMHSWAIWPVVFVLGTGAYAIYTVALAELGDSFQGGTLIAGAAAFSAMWGVGGIIGPPVAGTALAAIDTNGVPLVIAGIYVLLIAGLTVSRGRLVPAEA